jgi:uncharacterized repeat protein (TIGR01451 family)
VLVGGTAVLAHTLIPITNAAPEAVNLVEAFPGITFNTPVDIAHAGDGRLFIVERAGTIRSATLDQLATSAPIFLDIVSQVSSGGETGLLGLAFHPNFASNGYFYVNYTTLISSQLHTRISRFSVTESPNVADPASELVLLQLAQPFSNHNGGDLNFGPDGYLYVGLGDGGSGGDPDGRAQNVNDLLGKILRLDVDGGGIASDCGSSSNYTIPANNPFVGTAGCDEIWAIGLRNPWRFSFDRQTGAMFIGDVGQNAIEEIDYQPAGTGGVNWGWNTKEGTACYEPATGCDSTGLTDPIYEYEHSNNRCSITGGFVYRGSQYPALADRYLYADFCTGEVWSLTAVGGNWNGTLTNNSLAGGIGQIATFGEDANGEVYLGTFSSTGLIYRIQDDVPAPVLSISKTAPLGVASGEPFSYTLTVSNHGNAPATSLVISDTLPVNANYVNGGSLNGNTVTWNVPNLAASATISVQFTVTATQTIVNQDFGVMANDGYRAPWTQPILTLVDPKYVYLPIVLRE